MTPSYSLQAFAIYFLLSAYREPPTRASNPGQTTGLPNTLLTPFLFLLSMVIYMFFFKSKTIFVACVHYTGRARYQVIRSWLIF